MFNFGKKIVIQGKERHYIGGDIWLVAIDYDCSYSDIVTQISSVFCISNPFLIKCQLPRESLKYLITIASDDDLANFIEVNTSCGPAACRHFFVLPNTSSLPSNLTLGKILEEHEVPSSKKLQMRLAKNLPLYHYHLDLQRKMKEAWVWKPCLLSKEDSPQDQENCQLSQHEPRGVSLT